MKRTKSKPKPARVGLEWFRGPANRRDYWSRTLKLIPGYDSIATAPPGSYFDATAADDAVAFFAELLHHVKGPDAGKAFALEPWQAAIVGCLFGWKLATDLRRYRKSLVFVPRKNGKTALCAGLVLLMLVTDREAGAEIYGAAASRDQARQVFDHAQGMVRAEPELWKRLRIFRSVITYENGPAPAKYELLSSDGDLQHGRNVHGAIVDELHVQKSEDLVDVLETGTGARTQPLIVYITTAGYDRESVCWEKYEYACKVRDGVVEDGAFLPAIYEAAADDDWADPKVWRKANPNLGVSVSADYLAGECEKAKRIPRYENTFRRLHLNQWTEQSSRWISLEAWDACCGDVDAVALRERLRGRRCYGGIDLSSTTDLTAFALVFPPDEPGQKWHTLRWSWVPEDSAAERSRGKRKEAPYVTWANRGLIELTPGRTIEYALIRKRINELRQLYDIQEVGYDPWNAQYLCAEQLGSEDGLQTVAIRQGMGSMSEPSKVFERLVLSGALLHGGDPVTRWAVSHLSVRTDANDNYMPDKKSSGDRIDPVVATIIALARASLHGNGGRSIYETDDLLVL